MPSLIGRRHLFRLLLPVAAAVSLGALSGCGGPQSKMPDFRDQQVPVSGLTAEQVGAAIANGCKLRGWQIDAAGPNTVAAQYNHGRLMAAVTIQWTATAYTIMYRDSAGMRYNPHRNSIHPRFVMWMRNLRRTINNEFLRLGASPQPI